MQVEEKVIPSYLKNLKNKQDGSKRLKNSKAVYCHVSYTVLFVFMKVILHLRSVVGLDFIK